MAVEIERKFLVRDNRWRAHAGSGAEIRQGYLCDGDSVTVRVRLCDDRAWLNIKSATVGLTRAEYSYEIAYADAKRMLDELCPGPVIEKTRYEIQHAGHIWEVDVFDGDNDGLVVAEIELGSEQEAFSKPEWVAEEVSQDPRYFNAALARCPYRSWIIEP